MADPFTNKAGEQFAREVAWNGYAEGLTPDVVEVLNRAQQLVDFPITLISGYRDPGRNQRVDGAKQSQHMEGKAVDISLKGLSNDQRTMLTRALAQSGATRLGAYSGNTSLHLDMKKQAPAEGYPVWPMFDKYNRNMSRAPNWFTAGLDGGKIPMGYVPEVGTLTDTQRPAPIPASLPPQMAFTRQMTLPTYDVTPVLDRRSKKSIENRKEVSVNSGINLPLQNALMPPQPQLRPTAAPYKTAGKVQLNDDRFASGMADKNVSGTTQVASLAPMPPIPRPRPVTSVPKLVADQVLPRGTFRTADLVVQPNPIIPPINNGAGPNIAEKQARALPRPVTKTAMVPNPAYVPPKTAAPGAGLTEAQMRAIRGDFSPAPPSVPQYIPKTITVPGPVAPIPMPRSMRPADPGLNGNPSFQFGTPGLPAGLPAQVPPTRALPPMPRPRPMMPPMVTVSGAAPRAMPPMPLPRPMGMPVQQFQAQGLSPQQAYAAANQAAQERAIANSRDPERNAARAALAARWGFD